MAAQEDYVTNVPPLADRLTPEVLATVFPAADHAVVLEGEGPPTAGAYRDDTLLGYVFSTLDVLRAHGYSGTPFDVVAGVDLDGRITGATVLFHREPLIMEDERLTRLM